MSNDEYECSSSAVYTFSYTHTILPNNTLLYLKQNYVDA